MKCCNGNDPACPTHGVAASNARQNEYWKRVGGHPDAGEVDGPDSELVVRHRFNVWVDVHPDTNVEEVSRMLRRALHDRFELDATVEHVDTEKIKE